MNLNKEAIENPYRARWWGSDYTVQPKLVDAILGDGKLLIGFQPLQTRPHYYVIRIDSTWHLEGSCRKCEGRCPDSIYEHLDEIYEAIAEQFGNRQDREYENETHPDEEPEETTWPVLDDECGSAWFRIDESRYLPHLNEEQLPSNVIETGAPNSVEVDHGIR